MRRQEKTVDDIISFIPMNPAMTVQEVADALGVSPQAVRQTEGRAVKKVLLVLEKLGYKKEDLI